MEKNTRNGPLRRFCVSITPDAAAGKLSGHVQAVFMQLLNTAAGATGTMTVAFAKFRFQELIKTGYRYFILVKHFKTSAVLLLIEPNFTSR